MKKITFVGLGAMGLPMAKNLIFSGYQVCGIDKNLDSVKALDAMGGTHFESNLQAYENTDVLIIMVINSTQAKEVLLAEGALNAMPHDACVCLMSTCPPAEVADIDLLVTQGGKQFVDCPVSGGVAGAINGTLTLMAACKKATYEQVLPIFNVLGKRIFHVGEQAGQGAMCKTINQLLCGLHLAVAAEAFSLAKKGGLDTKLLLEIMSGSSASSWMLNDRGNRMLQNEPEVTSTVDIFVKDLSIVSQAGRDTKAALPLTAVALQMFLSASGRGEGLLDDSQVIRSYDALNGTQTYN
jgi:3-hydroxyisobutyrate dehydrogenase